MNTVLNEVLDVAKLNPATSGASTAKSANLVTERYVHIEDVGMRFVTKKGTFEALTNVNLSINQGEFVSIIGHSGCGKSTVLNLIAGLLQPTSGYLFCAGREISKPGPERAVVFQNHSLLPWLTCFENVQRSLQLRRCVESWFATLAGWLTSSFLNWKERTPAGPHVGRVAHEGGRLGETEEGAEGQLA